MLVGGATGAATSVFTRSEEERGSVTVRTGYQVRGQCDGTEGQNEVTTGQRAASS